MAGGGFEQGLSRVSSKETNQHKQGRTGSETPKTKLQGDSNPTSSGGINRATMKSKVTR